MWLHCSTLQMARTYHRVNSGNFHHTKKEKKKARKEVLITLWSEQGRGCNAERDDAKHCITKFLEVASWTCSSKVSKRKSCWKRPGNFSAYANCLKGKPSEHPRFFRQRYARSAYLRISPSQMSQPQHFPVSIAKDKNHYGHICGHKSSFLHENFNWQEKQQQAPNSVRCSSVVTSSFPHKPSRYLSRVPG